MARKIKSNNTETKSTSTSADPFASAFNDVESNKGFPELPLGEHSAFIYKGSMDSNDNWNTYVTVQLITENGHKGSMFFGLEDSDGEIKEVGTGILKDLLETVEKVSPGHKYASREEIEELIESFESDPVFVHISVKAGKKGFQNVRVKKLLNPEDAENSLEDLLADENDD